MSDGLNRDYQVCNEIGSGRFGTVYRCVSADTNETFAVKTIIKADLADDSIDRQCLEKEAKIMQLLNGHPSIINLVNLYEDEKVLHMVMEICESADLFEKIENRVLSETEAFSIMQPLMEAIAHCHRRGVCHRDIKPDNILFADSKLKLADFGSAEMFCGGEMMSGIVGTPYYVAPEVLSGMEYNEKVDVWSCGVILYVMLAGIPPFYGESPVEIFEAVLRGNLRFPTGLFRDVSSSAKDLLRRMLWKDVSRRFSAEQVLRHPWMLNRGE